jgi:hypothetical protein
MISLLQGLESNRNDRRGSSNLHLKNAGKYADNTTYAACDDGWRNRNRPSATQLWGTWGGRFKQVGKAILWKQRAMLQA